MSVEFTDILQLPKHKGKSVQAVFDTEPTYLLWLRDKKKDAGQPGYFDPTVLKALNGYLTKDKKAAAKFDIWNETPAGKVVPPGSNRESSVKAAVDDEERRPSLAEITQAQVAQTAYAELWGCF